MNTQSPAVAGRSRFWRQLLVIGKWIVEREELARDEDEPSPHFTGSSPLAWLASPDTLPNRTDSGPGRRGLLSWLVSRDYLPGGVRAPRPEPGFLGWMAAREILPDASSERLPATRSFLRWLLSSEPHARVENLHSTEEVPPHET